MLDANRVTLIAANLAEPFHPRLPSDITRLDYHGRELETWSAAKNEEKFEQAADGLEKTWGLVVPQSRSTSARRTRKCSPTWSRN